MKFKGVYFWIALPVAIVVIWLLAFYLPISSEIRSSGQGVLALKYESEKMDNEIASTNTLVQRDRQMQKSLKDFTAQVPQVAALPDFIRWLTKRAKETGLSVSRIDSSLPPSDETQGSIFLHPIVEIDLQGRFLEMGRFLDDISQRFVFNSILKAKVSSVERENPVLSAKYVVELNVWREQQSASK
jgi:Tfp pilus assembly protein PilO